MFDEVFTTYPTLLMLMNREEEAIQMLQESIQICEYLELKNARAKVLLMLTSIEINNNKILYIESIWQKINVEKNLIEC